MSCKLEPAIWPRGPGTGQRIDCFDSCQLIVAIVAWLSNIKEYTVNQGFISLSTTFLYGRHVARLRRRRRRRRHHAYATHWKPHIGSLTGDMNSTN